MSKAWFAPKRYGYGASLPISWQGWAVLVVFFAATWAVVFFSRQLPSVVGPLVRFGGLAVAVTGLVLIARAKTEGGWRWRNGGK